jgi:hypothetical protein
MSFSDVKIFLIYCPTVYYKNDKSIIWHGE